MPRLAPFIREKTERILMEWETFARALPIGGTMDVAALRDHAAQMLAVIADDLEAPQTHADQRAILTAAQEHGAGRADSGFSISQMVAEFRALRASVTRLWIDELRGQADTDLDDLVHFNEAIDQAIAESITRYTGEIAQSKERFLAILGHDLRNPLGAIIMSSGFMLETGELSEPHLTLVTRIVSSARRMNQMVEDLLDFTRTRFGDSIPIVREDADLRRIITDVANETGARYPDSDIQVETLGDLRGQWDCDRLSQALTNLVSNAIQHGARDTPIKVSARGLPGEVHVSVHNDGGVIPADRLAHMFDAMANARHDGVRDRVHLGLGLYIVDRIVSAHGGSITVRSERGEGTTFAVSLPRVAPSGTPVVRSPSPARIRGR